MFKSLAFAGLLIGMAVTGNTAQAANCAMRDTVVERLQTKYAEQLTAGGLQSSHASQSMLEVWASPDTGTFTVLLTNPNGISCVVATGTDFFNGPVKAEPAGIPS